MSELKTKRTTQDVREFLNTVEPEQKRQDSFTLLEMFEQVTGKKPVMWGTSMVGFGMYHYKSERSRQEGDWPLVAFSPRKQNLTLYLMGFRQRQDLLEKLGKYKIGGGCLYINKLADVDQKVLSELVDFTYKEMQKNYAV